MARVLPILFSFALISAGPQKSGSDLVDEISQALKPFRVASGVTLGIKKKTVSPLLGREKLSKGKMSYRKGKVRIEMEAPEASLLVMDGKTIWLETQRSAVMAMSFSCSPSASSLTNWQTSWF